MKTIKSEKDHSKRFHDKIKKLLESAGFSILRSDYYKKGADIVAESDKIKIIVQCKSTEKLGKKYSGIDSLIDEYSKKAEKEKARVAILAFENYSIPEHYIKNTGNILKNDKVLIWNNKAIDYYRKSVNALKNYAKYSMYGDFGIFDKFEDPYFAEAIKISQPGGAFYCFSINPETLLKISYVFRRAYNPDAYQRMPNPTRLKNEIGPFLESNDAIIPNTIVCVFKDNVNFDQKSRKLEIPMNYSSVWVVDGQHRLYGFCHTKPEKRSDFNLVCTGFNSKELPTGKQGKMFININGKSKRIDQNLLLDLYEMLEIKDLRVEVVKELSKTRLFKNKIKMPGQEGDITLATFALTSIMDELLKDGGILSKYSNEKNDDKFKYFCINTIKNYFELISKLFPKEWKDPKKYIISTNRGIRGFLRLLPFILEYSGNVNNIQKIKYCLKTLKGFEFKNDRLKGKYLGESGADDFAKNLCVHIRNKIENFAPTERQEVIDEIVIEPGNRDKAEEFLEKWLQKLKGNIVGELTFVDSTTFNYLKKLNFKKIKSMRLIVSGIKEDDKCKEIIEDEISKGAIKIEILKMKIGKEQESEREYEHERWLAGDNYQIDFNTDLKQDALGNKKHTIKVFSKVELSTRIINFKREWVTLIKKAPKGFRMEIFYPA